MRDEEKRRAAPADAGETSAAEVVLKAEIEGVRVATAPGAVVLTLRLSTGSRAELALSEADFHRIVAKANEAMDAGYYRPN